MRELNGLLEHGVPPPMAQIRGALHAMCQPLTALLCLLEMAEMEADPGEARWLVGEALRESERLRGTVRSMQEMVQPASGEELGRNCERQA